MPKSNYLDQGLLELVFQALPLPNIADNASSAPLTNLYLSLHTGDPGVAGNQSTGEAAYGSYARVPVLRSPSGWTLTGETINPVAVITFPTATSGTEVETHFGIGTDPTGAGNLLYYGSITPNISVSTGVIPQLSTASTVTES